MKPSLEKFINRVHNGKVRFEMNSKSKRWKVYIIDRDDADFDSDSDNVIDPEAFMVGDLNFFSMMLGKENFDSYWCYLCMLCHADWQKKVIYLERNGILRSSDSRQKNQLLHLSRAQT